MDEGLRYGTVNRIVELEGTEFFTVDMLPYKVQNREKFYDRTHPKNISPFSLSYKRYWHNTLTNCVEGKWVMDGDTWFFIPPKMYFYLNIISISDNGRVIAPRMRDNEIIMFYYYFIVDGFSGFAKDNKYTSCYLVQLIEDGVELNYYQKNKLAEIESELKDEHGNYKRYVDPWIYLTEHYLVNDKQDKPLGLPLYHNQRQNGMALTSRTFGKDLVEGTKVFKDHNTTCDIKDVRIGDQILGSSGYPVNVISKTEYTDQQQYKIRFEDGRTVECGQGHLWKVKRPGSRSKWQTLETKELYKNITEKRERNKHRKGEESYWFIPNNDPIPGRNKSLPIDPYFLGLWLGDGSSNRVGITTIDKEIKDYYYKIAEKYKLKININQNTNKTCPTYFITAGRGNSNGIKRPLNDKFKKLNLFDNKHIPDIYFNSTIEQRKELLKGLMDSDGSCRSSTAEFTSSQSVLANDFEKLVRGLGIKTRRTKRIPECNGKEGKISNRFLLKSKFNLFKLNRKATSWNTFYNKLDKKSTRNVVGIKEITLTKVKPSYCIAVDSVDKLFLVDNYITAHNSYITFLGDFLHEWLLNGIRRMSDIGEINNKLLFGIGSLDPEPLERSLANIEDALSKLPGMYAGFAKYLGAFAKKTSGGKWEAGNTIKHQVQKKNRANEILGNIAQLVTIKANKAKVVAGDRFRRIYLEEVGFIPHITSIHTASDNSLKVGEEYYGSMMCIGTGGNQEAIEGSKLMFENPEGYNVASIRNFFMRSNKKIRSGLFIPVVYAKEEFKDPQGNTLLIEALKDVVAKRIKDKANKDATDYLESVMFNPLYPKELLIPTTRNRFPVAEMADHKGKLIENDIMKTGSISGWLEWDKSKTNGVRFDLDFKGKREVITKWGQEDKHDSLEGALLIHEDVMEDAPQGLYHVIVDPVALSGKGSSLNSVLVYKADYVGAMDGMRDNIVAEWTGRLDQMDDTHEFIVRVSKYYNSAQIFLERNVPNFLEYCREHGFFHLLHDEPIKTLELIQKGKVKRSYWGKGVRMNNILNQAAYLDLAQWFKTITQTDKEGIPTEKKLHQIKSLRILDEAINYDPEFKTQFDTISSLYLLMLLKIELKQQNLQFNLTDPNEDEIDNVEQYEKGDDGTIKFLDY